jgi:hypothetical protein
MSSPYSSSETSVVSYSTLTAIDALISGIKWGGATGTGITLTYSFPWTTSDIATFAIHYSSLNEPNAALHYGLDAIQQEAVRSALQSWANVANIVFSEVAETSSNVGDIRVAWTSADTDQVYWGWSRFPDSYSPSAGDVWISTLGVSDPDWSVGSYNYMALIHEFGHSLGLKHPFDDDPVLPSDQDSQQYTVMSYTEHPQSLFVRVTSIDDTYYSWSASIIEPDTPMLYDIAAIQYIYGANLSYRTGDDVYTFDPDTPFIRTLWDAGGTDTISVSNFVKGCILDLRQGHFSKITIESDSTSGIDWSTPPPTATYDGTDNLAIAFNCIIENAIGGSGDDTLIGNDAVNRLDGGAGDDVIYGSAGDDTLIGGVGTDTVVVNGIASQYTYSQGAEGTTMTGPEGTDTLNGIEYIRLGSSAYTTDILLSDATTSNSLRLAEQITDLYVAYFNRGPDAEGFDYWFHEIYTGSKSLRTIAEDFAWSDEYQTLYSSSLTNDQFVEQVYLNLFDRSPDQGGWDYWSDRLDTGSVQRSGFILDIIEGAYASTSGPEDSALIDNKHDASLYYTGQLVLHPEEGYDSAVSDLLNLITSDENTTIAAERVIDYAFDTPITLTGVMSDQALFDSLWGTT